MLNFINAYYTLANNRYFWL